MPKKSLPLSQVYRLIEPGPVVLLTTASAGGTNVMTMSWHSMLEFEPPLIGCVVSDRNQPHSMLQGSRECVLNIPTDDLLKQVVGCGNSSGATTDKFARYKLTCVPGELVAAPLIDECFANLECRVVDTDMVRKYCFFVLEVVKAWIDPAIKTPRTLHHRGYGSFLVATETIRVRSQMW